MELALTVVLIVLVVVAALGAAGWLVDRGARDERAGEP